MRKHHLVTFCNSLFSRIQRIRIQLWKLSRFNNFPSFIGHHHLCRSQEITRSITMRFCDPLQPSSNNEHLGWNYYWQEVLRFLRIFQLLINLSTIWNRQRNLFSISILKLGTGMTIPAFLQFRKNSLNASISISDHFRLCPQPSGDNISAPQVYSAALTVDHNINEFVNFLRLSTYTAGHIRLNLAAEVVPFFTTNFPIPDSHIY